MDQVTATSGESAIEIKLSDIFSFFRKYWLFFLLVGLVLGSIGYGISYLIAPEFETTAKILPEYGSGTSVDGLSDLASLAGISLGKSNSEAIRPDLYPSILTSKTFLMKVLSTPFPLQDGKKILLAVYLDKEGKPFTSQQLKQADTLITLTIGQERVMENVSERITAHMDKITGVLTIRSEMPDPVLSAACTNFSMNYLTNFVTEYRGSKKVEKVAFLRKQMSEAKSKNQRAEIALNSYRDRNRSAYTNVARVEEQRLQNDYIQTQSLYSELARQLETARLQALEDTPVLKVLDPPMVPNWKSKPRRKLYALSFAILGGFLAFLFVLFGREKAHQRLL